jgi:hypothetical protein
MEFIFNKRGLLFFSFIFIQMVCMSQSVKPSEWTLLFSKEHFIKNDTVTLYLIGQIPDSQGVYSTKFKCNYGPKQTKVTFKNFGKDFVKVDSAISVGDSLSFDEIFECSLRKFKKTAIIKQVLLIKNPNAKLNGLLEYQTCNDDQCLKFTCHFETIGTKVTKMKNGKL